MGLALSPAADALDALRAGGWTLVVADEATLGWAQPAARALRVALELD